MSKYEQWAEEVYEAMTEIGYDKSLAGDVVVSITTRERLNEINKRNGLKPISLTESACFWPLRDGGAIWIYTEDRVNPRKTITKKDFQTNLAHEYGHALRHAKKLRITKELRLFGHDIDLSGIMINYDPKRWMEEIIVRAFSNMVMLRIGIDEDDET